MRWSYSVHTAMRRCQRQLVFAQVLASPLSRDPERREAHVLKQLQHLSAWHGNLVHKVLANDFLVTLMSGQAIDPGALTRATLNLAQRQFPFSAAKLYREPGQTKTAAGDDYCALFEHEYEREIPSDVFAEVQVKATRCFENLASQQSFLASLYAGSGHLAELRLNFRFNGTALMAIPDLVFLHADGQPTVIDWKVADSETSDYAYQLLVYALAVARSGRWPQVRPEAIELYEANLLKNQIRRYPVTHERLEEAEDFVYRSLVELETLVDDGKYEHLDMNEFEVAERPLSCYHCNFASLCIRQLEAGGHSKEAAVVQGRLL
ncbi:MAG: PD-(D/E)XK nuclease family protein [Dehalococcoidia bacterium]